MVYKAIALDLDGTLMDSNKKLSEVNKETIWKALDKDVVVILASGRPLFGVMPVANALEFQKRGGYVLAYNGGQIVDCKTGETTYSREIPSECIADICRIARAYNVQPLTYFEDRILAESDIDEYVIKEAICNSAKIKVVEDVNAFVNYPVAKLLVVGEHTKLLPVQEELKQLHGDKLDIFFSEEYFLEVVPKNVAKDASLAALLEILNIKQEELIACGDAMNDVSMIKYAGLGVAMDNAYPNIKEYADYIAPSNDDNGVAYVIDKFMLQ